MLTLSILQRQQLKARAHALDPVVIIGNAGLTDAVLNEIARSLKSHELIKIRAPGERDERAAMMQTICERLDAAPVQHIGKILLVYQPQMESEAADSVLRKGRKPQTKKQMGNRN
jgi:putative YhbY family RNA-binding protein